MLILLRRQDRNKCEVLGKYTKELKFGRALGKCLCRWAFEELATIAEMKFRFAEEEDACEYVTRLAADLLVRHD